MCQLLVPKHSHRTLTAITGKGFCTQINVEDTMLIKVKHISLLQDFRTWGAIVHCMIPRGTWSNTILRITGAENIS